MNEHMTTKEKVIHILIGCIVIIVPLLPLFIFRYFYVDWANNLWVIQYYAKWFKEYHNFPLVINTANDHVGMTNPLYYGYLYYQGMGFLAAVLGGARRAVISSALVLLIMIYELYTRLLMRMLKHFGRNEFWLVHGMVMLMLWSTYVITKVYGDGARSEYFAILLLYLVLGTWMFSLFQKSWYTRLPWWIFAAAGMLIIAGTHPITTEIGGGFMAVVILISLPYILRLRTDRVPTILAGSFLILLIAAAIAPWLYVCKDSAAEVVVSGNAVIIGTKSGIIGNVINRIMPLPFDIDSLFKGREVLSPYFDLQINMPLAGFYLVTLILLFREKMVSLRRKAAGAGIMLLTATVFALCSMDGLSEIVGRIFYSIQFPFRLITYVDLLILIGSIYDLFVLGSVLQDTYRKILFGAMLVCVTLSAHNVLIQMTQAYGVAGYYEEDISSDAAPGDFYWRDDYTLKSVPQIPAESAQKVIKVRIPLQEGKLQTAESTVQVDKATVINTNIAISPYNRILLNGEAVDKVYRLSEDSHTCAFVIEKPGTYTITYAFHIAPVYYTLRKLSGISVFVMGIFVMMACGLEVKRLVISEKK